MSSDKPDEKSGRRKPKVSWGRIILPWVRRYLSRGRGRARVPADRRGDRPRRAARRPAGVVRALGRSEDRDGLGHRDDGLDRGRAAADRAVHAGRRRAQRGRRRHQRRGAAVLQRRGDDADAHARRPDHDAAERDGAGRQAGARLLGRRVGRGQLRDRRLRADHGAERPGAVLGRRPRRRLPGAASLLRAHLRRARRALSAPGADDRSSRSRRRRGPAPRARLGAEADRGRVLERIRTAIASSRSTSAR